MLTGFWSFAGVLLVGRNSCQICTLNISSTFACVMRMQKSRNAVQNFINIIEKYAIKIEKFSEFNFKIFLEP